VQIILGWLKVTGLSALYKQKEQSLILLAVNDEALHGSNLKYMIVGSDTRSMTTLMYLHCFPIEDQQFKELILHLAELILLFAKQYQVLEVQGMITADTHFISFCNVSKLPLRDLNSSRSASAGLPCSFC
jgi:hypothetical protein